MLPTNTNLYSLVMVVPTRMEKDPKKMSYHSLSIILAFRLFLVAPVLRLTALRSLGSGCLRLLVDLSLHPLL